MTVVNDIKVIKHPNGTKTVYVQKMVWGVGKSYWEKAEIDSHDPQYLEILRSIADRSKNDTGTV